MKRKMSILIYTFLAVAISLLSIYFLKENSKKKIPKQVLETIKSNRIEEINEQEPDSYKEKVKGFLYHYTDFNDEIPKDKMIEIIKEPSQIDFNKKIKVEDAKEDIDCLFRLLKYNYSGYEFNGGDRAFDKAKKDILFDINNQTAEIGTYDFIEILISNLSFINDAHFAIAQRNISKHYQYYTSEEHKFLKDNNGYYTYLNKDKYYLIDMDGLKPKEALKQSIDSEGKIVYFPGRFEKSDKHIIFSNLNLKKKKKTEKIQVILRKPSNKNFDNIDYSYALNYRDKIPVIEITRMFEKEKDSTELQKFISDAALMKDKDIIIIDARGNGGGYSIYPFGWFKNFTGEEPKDGSAICKLKTESMLNAMEYNIKSKVKQDGVKEAINNLEELRKEEGEYKGWSKVYSSDYKRIDNKTTIIVLMDSCVASSGEELICYLRLLKNVIFVGTNTSGFVTIGDNMNYILPASNIPVFFGSNIIMSPGVEENKGYLPDFWVQPENSLDRVIKFIKNYDLKDFEK